MFRQICFAALHTGYLIAFSTGAAHAQMDRSQDAAWKAVVDNALGMGFKFDVQCYGKRKGVFPHCARTLTGPIDQDSGRLIQFISYTDLKGNIVGRQVCLGFFIPSSRTCYNVETTGITIEIYDRDLKAWMLAEDQGPSHIPLSPKDGGIFGTSNAHR